MTTYDQLTTVIMPTSPSPSHPDTRIIDETLRSVRHHFPESAIFILADGVRPELAHRRQDYSRYLDTLEERKPAHTHIYRFLNHHHQTAMVKKILPEIPTSLLLWIEHDLPIRTDVPTDWQMMSTAIMSSRVDLCRLMLHEGVHPEHEHLYRPPMSDYPHLRPQRQFSGWTHLASTSMYRRLLKDYDPSRGRLMVERYVGGIIESGGWEQWKLTSYIPDPMAARRIYHLHGRGGVDGGEDDPTFVWLEKYLPR